MANFLDSIGYNGWVLPALLLIPLVGTLVIMLLPSRESRESGGVETPAARSVALGLFVLEFLISLGLWWSFNPSDTGWQAAIDMPWIPTWGVRFTLGIDGIALMMVLLTTFIMPLAVLGSWTSIRTKVRGYYGLLLILTSGMIGVFLARDLFLFYVMWEVMLIPMYFIIGIWGGDRKLYAAIKFVLYTMVGSLLMIVAIIYLYIRNHDATGVWSFDYDTLLKVVLSPKEQLYCFGAFALAFCIKVPLFPFHTWLPDAHVEAPTAGSVVLASVMLKFGTYGLLRYAIPFFPDAFVRCAPLLNTLAVIGIIYGSLVAFAQKDVKKLIAYSSVAHLGFVVLGLGMWNVKAVDGAMLINLSHGIATGGLFLCIGVIYERRHTRKIDEFGGLATIMPRYFGVFMVMTLASVGLPGTSGFVGEFLTLLGSFDAYKGFAKLGVLFPHPKALT
ncbi:MAG TPA: NADH-quinone oxidoreductase subunit M, partial [Gemmatimonadaceae bacterium]|nr:NADH-quinone oxidoreductase subunit M [Gemmatimonadaceae bacterium]